MKPSARPLRHRSTLVVILAIVILSLVWIPSAQAAPPPAPTQSGSCGWWYAVQAGDSWLKLSRRSGVSVADMQAANPQHVHPPHYWLYRGHQLWFPCDVSQGYWYAVQKGDTWNKLAARTGWSVGMLQRANPDHQHPPRYWLYTGHWLWIPGHVSPPPPAGYWYTVQRGDTWARLSWKTGVPVGALQAANPNHLHSPRHWLYVGHKLWIPTP